MSALDALAPLFRPQNVAIIGASKTPGKQGHTALTYLKRGGFAGGIFLVNPSESEIEGLACYHSIADVPVTIDCALLVIPAAASVQAVRDCATRGVRSVIIGATGYAELGTDEGRARQTEILRIAHDVGMRVLGPNTNGIYNASDCFSFGYNRSHGEPLMPGPVSVAAHSGALFNSLNGRLRELGVGLSKFVPVGNEADLTMLDFVEYFIADPATRVIGLIIEAISDGPRFRQLALKAFAAGKPIVALKLGRSQAGAGATEAHSSRLAGSARAYDAFFREHGIASVPTVEALAGACAVLTGDASAFRQHFARLRVEHRRRRLDDRRLCRRARPHASWQSRRQLGWHSRGDDRTFQKRRHHSQSDRHRRIPEPTGAAERYFCGPGSGRIHRTMHGVHPQSAYRREFAGYRRHARRTATTHRLTGGRRCTGRTS